MAEHIVEVEPGVSLFAQDLGSGRPIVLLHGWALSHEVWDRQVNALVSKGYRVVALDLRGHGHSSRPFDGYDLEHLGADVIGVIEALGLGRVTLVGWSLGGLTAFRVAVSRPDLLEKLVLVCSNGVATSRQPGLPFGADAKDVEDAVLAAELDDRVASREAQIRSAVQPRVPEATMQWLLALTLRVPSWAGRATLRTVLNANQVDDAETLSVPLVQILGTADPRLSKRAAAWLLDRVPRARQLWVEDSGHFPMFENPAGFDAALLDAVGID